MSCCCYCEIAGYLAEGIYLDHPCGGTLGGRLTDCNDHGVLTSTTHDCVVAYSIH